MQILKLEKEIQFNSFYLQHDDSMIFKNRKNYPRTICGINEKETWINDLTSNRPSNNWACLLSV